MKMKRKGIPKFFNIFGNFPAADGHQPSHPLTVESSVEEKLNQISVISSRYVILKNFTIFTVFNFNHGAKTSLFNLIFYT